MPDEKDKRLTFLRRLAVPLISVVLVLLIGTTFVLYRRLIAMEERLSYIEPDLYMALLSLELSTSEISQRTPARSEQASKPKRLSEPRDTLPDRGKRETPLISPKNYLVRPARKTSATAADAGYIRPRTTRPAATSGKQSETPEEAVENFINVLSSATADNAGKTEVKTAYVRLIKQGESAADMLLLLLDDLPTDGAWNGFAFDAVEELSTRQHKDEILSLFEIHDELAGAVSALQLWEAVPMILAKLKEEGEHPPQLLESVSRMKITEGYPLIGKYASETGDVKAVKILASIPENIYDATNDLVSIVENRDNWIGQQDADESVRRAAEVLTRKGNRIGLNYLVSRIEEKGYPAMDRSSVRTLRRCIEYSGSNRDFGMWLAFNAPSLEWSETKRRFVLP